MDLDIVIQMKTKISKGKDRYNVEKMALSQKIFKQ